MSGLDLADAIISLAKASAEIGVVFREVVARQDLETAERQETNRWLAKIFDQNASIAAGMEKIAAAARESDRALRVVMSTVESHAQHLVAIGKKVGVPAPEPGAIRRSAADR